MINCASVTLGEREIDRVRQVLLSGNLAQGTWVQFFEQAWAEYCETSYGVAVNSGTAALHSALLALGVGPGDEVIIPPLGFFATVEAVLYVGATPVFVDVAEDGTLDPESTRREINGRTRAIIPVHTFGLPADVQGLWKVAQEQGVPLVFDAAQAHGAVDAQKHKVGEIGTLTCFSFYATKHLTTGGEGGMVVTASAEHADTIRRIRSHGMTGQDRHTRLGFNYRMTEIAAVIGLAQMEDFDLNLTQRIVNCRRLLEAVDAMPGIARFDAPESGRVHSYFWCPVQLDDQIGLDFFREHMRRHGVEIRHRYRKLFYDQPIMDRFPHRVQPGLCPTAERIAERVVGLPARSDLSEKEIDHIITAVHGVLNEC